MRPARPATDQPALLLDRMTSGRVPLSRMPREPRWHACGLAATQSAYLLTLAGIKVSAKVGVRTACRSLRVHDDVAVIVIVSCRGAAGFMAPEAFELLAVPVVN